MAVSVFDMFKVGIGPSSSHTVGPMRAGHAFVKVLRDRGMLEQATSLKIELMGSLAATGKGHGTDTAAQLGLLGRIPETMDPDEVSVLIGDIRASRQLKLDGMHAVAFDPEADIAFHADKDPAFHTNAMSFRCSRATLSSIGAVTIPWAAASSWPPERMIPSSL